MEDKLKEIGALIRQARKKKKLSQMELASLVHISVSHMSDIENGKKKIGIDIFARVAEALDVSADWLLQLNTGESAAITNPDAVDILSDCTQEETQAILKIMKDVKSALRSVSTSKY